MKKNRAKLFIENFLAYGLVNALNQIVPIIMLPIVARLLSDTAEYGKFDMFNTIVNFGSSFAILGIYDAMFREYFEKDDYGYKKKVTSTGYVIVLVASSFVMLLMIAFSNTISNLFFGNNKNVFIVCMASIGVFLAANRAIIAAPTRMENKKKIYVISGVSYSIVYYLLSIILISIGFGYKGLIFGNIFATFLIVVFFLYLNKQHFKLKLFDNIIAKELIKVGLPGMPTFLIYWVFNSMDKIMISNMQGMAQMGIYSIGAKVASVSQFIYSAFAGGWQYFAFSTMKDDDQVNLISNVFEYLGIFSFVIFLLSTLVDDIVFQILFTGDYIKGVNVFPYLFLSPLILMLFQIAGNQFLIIKKSYFITFCLIIGCIINVILNYILIGSYGIKGAALATLIGYIISTIIIVIASINKKLLHMKFRFVLSALIVLVIIVLNLLCIDNYLRNILTLVAMILILTIYSKDIKVIINLLIKKYKS